MHNTQAHEQKNKEESGTGRANSRQRYLWSLVQELMVELGLCAEVGMLSIRLDWSRVFPVGHAQPVSGLEKWVPPDFIGLGKSLLAVDSQERLDKRLGLF